MKYKWLVTLKCKAGHEQQITFDDEFSAKNTAQLIDGTHPMYVSNPRSGPHESGWIGHCLVGRTPTEFPPFTIAQSKAEGACGELVDSTVLKIQVETEKIQ